MFILIPLSLMVIACIGIFVVIWRKMPYLRKLDLETMNEGGVPTYSFTWREFFHDMFPEVYDLFFGHTAREYKDIWLSELEKFVRRLRLISLKLDHMSDALIKKIRRVNRQQPTQAPASVVAPDVEAGAKVVIQAAEKKPVIDMTALKQEEQKLIIEIAKNPKDAKLYVVLADVYITMESWSDAKESLEAALELNASDETLKKKLSSVLEKMPRSEDTKKSEPSA